MQCAHVRVISLLNLMVFFRFATALGGEAQE